MIPRIRIRVTSVISSVRVYILFVGTNSIRAYLNRYFIN